MTELRKNSEQMEDFLECGVDQDWTSVLRFETLQTVLVARPLPDTVSDCIKEYGASLTKSAITALVLSAGVPADVRLTVKELLNRKEFVAC